MSGVCFLHILPSDVPWPLASASSLVLFTDIHNFNFFRPMSTCLPEIPLEELFEYVMDFMSSYSTGRQGNSLF